MRYQGLNYPIVLFPAPKSQRYKLESALGPLNIELQEVICGEFEQLGQEYLKRLLKSAKPPWDDPTYRMVSFNSNDQITFSCALGGYFNMLKTCDILEFELLTEFGKQYPPFPNEYHDFINKLKLRRYLHSMGDPMFEPLGRSVAISISTLIIYAENDTYKALIRERSGKVAVYQHLLHIIPSFMFQPVVRCYDDEYSVRHNIYREYLEEIFGRRDLDRPTGELRHDFFYDDPNLRYLEELESKGKARFFFTGISMNLMSLRPEIHTLLLISDPEWISNQGCGRKVNGRQLDVIKVNWEFKHGDELRGARFEKIASVDLTADLLVPDALFKPENFVPVGAAGMKLGIDVAREELGF